MWQRKTHFFLTAFCYSRVREILGKSLTSSHRYFSVSAREELCPVAPGEL